MIVVSGLSAFRWFHYPYTPSSTLNPEEIATPSGSGEIDRPFGPLGK